MKALKSQINLQVTNQQSDQKPLETVNLTSIPYPGYINMNALIL